VQHQVSCVALRKINFSKTSDLSIFFTDFFVPFFNIPLHLCNMSPFKNSAQNPYEYSLFIFFSDTNILNEKCCEKKISRRVLILGGGACES